MKNEIKTLLNKGYKFVIVGIVSTILNYGIFAFLYQIINVHYILSSITGYISGIILGYLLNKNWTFITQIDKSKSYIVGYFTVYAISLVSSQAFLFLLVEFLLMNPLYANIFSIVLSTTTNFLGTNFFVFKNAGKTYA
ncbi:MAG: GtrA family protein [Candidatus Marinimicrobia bacterium]|jgi:putative flippase GtrA|nr:GtrA family protein [Candidatus Neomarinimicrobiota bacterium]